jgi:pyruvate/2-oxoglutarate dehydrogenase complex dihydrolipoamide dehydrogenase (E3) component
MAQAFSRLGTAVTLLEEATRVLPREDADAAAIVARQLAADGVTLRLGVTLAEVSKGRDGLHLKVGDGLQAVPLERGAEVDVCTHLLIAVGRSPNVDDLDLPVAGIAFNAEGVVVDDRLRTTNRRVFAAGDVCSTFKFTHAADALARIVIQNALFFGRKRASALVIPWCTYTDPEVAHVGLYARDAQARGIEIDTFEAPLAANDRARAEGEEAGFLKVHVRKGTDRIVGATVVARHAGELIAPLATAMASGAGLGRLVDLILPYPTQSELIKVVAGAYTRTRLTPFAARVLRGLIGLAR